MQFNFKSSEEADKVTREALWLAYQASIPMGMGRLHERGGENRDSVEEHFSPGQSLFADYVYGRMVKLSIWRKGFTTIEVQDDPPRNDYQSWSGKYKTYEDLINAAKEAISE